MAHQVLHSLVSAVEKVPATPAGCPLLLRCKNFQVIQFVIPQDRDCQDVHTLLTRLSRPGEDLHLNYSHVVFLTLRDGHFLEFFQTSRCFWCKSAGAPCWETRASQAWQLCTLSATSPAGLTLSLCLLRLQRDTLNSTASPSTPTWMQRLEKSPGTSLTSKRSSSAWGFPTASGR